MRGCQTVLTWGVRPHARESGGKSKRVNIIFAKKVQNFLEGYMDLLI